MATNGNGVLAKVVMGITGSILIAILSFMGAGIVNNDRLRAEQDITIREEIVAGDKEVDAKSENRHHVVLEKVECLEKGMNENFRQLFVEVGKVQAHMEDMVNKEGL